MTSLIYNNLFIYRLLMNVLYLGKYTERFDDIIKLIDPKKEKFITELCYGDVHIAEWCKANSVNWTWIDINQKFVNFAIKKRFNAICLDLKKESAFPVVDTVIIAGSLYHFHGILDEFLLKIMSSCSRLIISEPIHNLSNSGGFIGRIASHSANAGNGAEEFRYDKKELIKTLAELCGNRWILHIVNDQKRDIILEVTWK